MNAQEPIFDAPRWTACRRRDMVWLALLALAVRTVYLLTGLSSQDLAGVAKVASDSDVYLRLAEYLRTGEGGTGTAMLLAGPGYPGLLALLATLFGPGLWPPVLLNMLFAVAAPAAVYLLTLSLQMDRATALISGLVVALSFTGVSLSTSVLTDQPFYTIHLFALLMFLLGLRSGKTSRFMLAGLLAGLATCIRSLGQLWPFVFILLAVLHPFCLPAPRNWRRTARSLWTPGIMLVLILSWSAVNCARYGIFTFTTNGVRATWAYLAATAVSDHTPGGSFDSVRVAWWNEVYSPVGDRPPSEAESYGLMKTRVLEVLSQHPGWVAESFLATVWRNVRAPNYFAAEQVPRWRMLWDAVSRVCHDWINPLLLALTLAALVLLAVQRQWESVLVLGLTYVFFTLTTGFSFWQGSRLHYPAEMAWSILVAFSSVQGWRRLRRETPAAAQLAASVATARPE